MNTGQIDAFPLERRESSEILDDAIAEYKPVAVYAMFSGGHDSLCSTHVVSKHQKFSGVVHINTGIGIPETREFVRDTCKAHGWPLREISPPKMQYEDIVLKWGFPGPGGHFLPYRWLKERSVELLMRETPRKRGERVLLCTGVRLSESQRRMGHVGEVFRRGSQVWTAPILHWDDDDKHAYMEQHNLKRNWVVDVLCMSGECLCGAFARPGELDEIEMWFPDVAQRIKKLQDEAAAAGKHAEWGVRPPRQKQTNEDLPMCYSCQQKELFHATETED